MKADCRIPKVCKRHGRTLVEFADGIQVQSTNPGDPWRMVYGGVKLRRDSPRLTMPPDVAPRPRSRRSRRGR